ncbi:hypothetical protein [Bacillus sp. JCM 19034]|uniref:hypothetical protein n=1 Tax=Bacillus sp. JCM 19034 TaxID=1481928 RepID=UPI000781F5BC|nr:hypothetical protein [Bacillus sp. JCM 19034]
MFRQAKDEGRITELFVPDFDVFTDYLDQIGTVSAPYDQTEGRIVVGNKEDFNIDPDPEPRPEEPVDPEPEPRPEEPVDPDPEPRPEEPVDPDPEPTPEEPVDPDSDPVPTQEPKVPTDDSNKIETVKGDSLPNTATDMYNWLIIGVLLIVTGGCGLLVYHRIRLAKVE